MGYREILKLLKSLADQKAVAGMARFGIKPRVVYGVATPVLRRMAKEIGKNHTLARKLWASGIYDARIFASLIDEPEKVTVKQMENWVKVFDSWAVCDGCCGNLFRKTKFAYQKAMDWSKRNGEFVKRAGFVLMADLAVHDKKAKNDIFLKFLPVIKRESSDERHYVKKAVNWSLRQIGKRNPVLNRTAIAAAKSIQKLHSISAHWIGADALRELTSKKIQQRLR